MCEKENPELLELEGAHCVRCHLFRPEGGE